VVTRMPHSAMQKRQKPRSSSVTRPEPTEDDPGQTSVE
jgi:hypothetical protein